MPIALVQAKVGSTTTSGNSLAFTSNVTKGNLLVAVWEIQGTALTQPTTNGISDTVSSIWTPTFGSPQNITGMTPKANVNSWFAIAAASGANTVAQVSNAAGTIGLNALAIFEFSGFPTGAKFDSSQQSAKAGSNGTSVAAQPISFSTTFANCVVAVMSICSGGTPAPTLTVNSPFSAASVPANTNFASGYDIVAAAGSANFTGTWNGSSFTDNGFLSVGIAVASLGTPNSLMLVGVGT